MNALPRPIHHPSAWARTPAPIAPAKRARGDVVTGGPSSAPSRSTTQAFSHKPSVRKYGAPAACPAMVATRDTSCTVGGKTQPRLNPEFWGTCLAFGYLVVRHLSRSREHACSYATPSHIQGTRGNAANVCRLRHVRTLPYKLRSTISTVIDRANTVDIRTTTSCAVV